MSEVSPITHRTFDFAVRIVNLCKAMEEKVGVARTLSKQLIRSGTSIGANVEESQAAQSTADFVHKLEIALKEARETRYWLRLLIAVELFPVRIQNSKFKIQNSKFKIQNSKFKIQNPQHPLRQCNSFL
ncbi:MAG: four helix bundle protein [Moorea sp. SIO3E2]|nr:four helix bundle protein [Moorena sp. SIO3E2]